MSFLDQFLEKTIIQLDFKNVVGEWRFEDDNTRNDVFGWLINRIEDLQELIAVIITLVLYLKNNGYIAPYRVTPDKWSEVHNFGRGVEEDLKHSSPFPDKEIVALLIEYAYKEIVPLEPLYALKNNKYVSQEELRFKRQYKQAWCGIFIAIIIGCFGIWFNYASLQRQEVNAISQNRQIVESVEPLLIDLSIIVDLEKEQSNQLKQIKNTLEGMGKSNNTILKGIETNLERIDNSINELNEEKYNKQIQPTLKPRG